MSDTLGSIREEILLFLRGDLKGQADQQLVNATINDAIESIWISAMRVQISRFMGLDSPVSFTLPANTERVQLVSIPDPTGAPIVGSVISGALAQRTYLVGYTYVTESGSETQLSPTTSLLIPANSVATVNVPIQPANAFGWNLYVSVSNNANLLALQNQNPLAFNIGFTQEPLTGWQDFPVNSQGAPVAQTASTINLQPPSENTTADNISWITHLEVRTSDTLLRSWNQYDLNSDIMRRYGRELSSATEFQTYVWDLINGNRFEVRPTTGLAFTPRYFYIAKPRRLLYDQATVPYTQIPAIHEFIVNKSISRLKLALDEYISAQGWTAQAEASRNEVMKGLTAEDWGKDTRIAPHLF